ncbi:MAG: glycosyltransferase [Planctomycetota bacterium]|nr:glycosyltransferase [Planctomycetota bacterium]
MKSCRRRVAGENRRRMQVLLVTEYVRRSSISISRWAVELAHGLRSRGHTVSVACDGLDDPATFEPMELHVHRPRRSHLGANPFPFQDWVRMVREKLRHVGRLDLTVSLSPLVRGDLWLPVGPRAMDTITALVRTKKPLSAAMELVHVPWLPATSIAEMQARDHSGPPGTRLSIGPYRVSGGVGGGFGSGRAEQIIRLGYASRLPAPDPEEQAALRSRTRELLGINPSRPVVLATAYNNERRGLQEFLEGFAQVRRERTFGIPIAILVGRAGATEQAAAIRAGCLDGVRLVGRTERIDALMAAADLVAAPLAARDLGITTGRFICDALRCGRPVVALRRAPGSELLDPSWRGGDPVTPGWIIEHPDPSAWVLALNTTLSENWLAHRTPVARAAGAALSMDALLDRVEYWMRQRVEAGPG